MKTKITFPVVFLLAACAWQCAAQPAFDSSGDNQLNGTYYMRQVIYFQDSSVVAVDEAINVQGTITFNGSGTYTFNGTILDSSTGSSTPVSYPAISGTYVISASGEGYISAIDPNYSSDLIIGLVSPKGIFVGSSTENVEGYNDLFIAAPVGTTQATNATLNGTYQVVYMDATYAGVANTAPGGDALFTMTADGAGNIGTVNVSGYLGTSTTASSESLTGVTYSFQNGGAQLAFGGSSTSLIAGTQVLYISPDGNFVFGGNANGFDIFAGVRAATSNPSNYVALYYQAGLDMNETGGGIDSYYGASTVLAQNNNLIAHQRFSYGGGVEDITYSDSYTLNGDGSSMDDLYDYWSSSDGTIRVGYGLGPYLGINVEFQGPALSGSGVYVNPTGVVNAASSAPFTAQVSPGEFLTIYGNGLAPTTNSASIPFPTTLNGVQVFINDVAAPIYYVSPGQLEVIVPYITVPGSVANIYVVNNNTKSNTVSEFTGSSSVGVFTEPEGGIGIAAAERPDYSVITEENPARVGETEAIFLAGMGPVPGAVDGAAASNTSTTYTPQVELYDTDGSGNSAQATITYSGLAPGFAGLYQIDFTIPTGLDGGDEALEIYSGIDSDTSEAILPVALTASAARDKPAGRRRVIHPHRTGAAARHPVAPLQSGN